MVLVLFSFLACVGGPAPEFAPRTDLAAPWNDYAVPVGSGTVKSIDAKELHVVYRDGKVNPVSAQRAWTDTFTSKGWLLDDANAPMKSMMGLEFHRGDAKLEIIIHKAGKQVDVVAEFL